MAFIMIHIFQKHSHTDRTIEKTPVHRIQQKMFAYECTISQCSAINYNTELDNIKQISFNNDNNPQMIDKNVKKNNNVQNTNKNCNRHSHMQ